VRPYLFESAWHLPGTRAQVWEAVLRVEDWPSWWPAVRAVRVLDAGHDGGLDRRIEYLLHAPLGYRLAVCTRTTTLEPPRLVVVEVVGQLAGTGRWELSEEAGGVRVDQRWEVATTRPWMRLVAPLARPAFRWSHDRAARRGGEGLARWLLSGARPSGGPAPSR
jgi:hypothetical protein